MNLTFRTVLQKTQTLKIKIKLFLNRPHYLLSARIIFKNLNEKQKSKQDLLSSCLPDPKSVFAEKLIMDCNENVTLSL